MVVQADEKKVQAIKEWPTLTSMQQVQCFYRRPVCNFSAIKTPITELMMEDV